MQSTMRVQDAMVMQDVMAMQNIMPAAMQGAMPMHGPMPMQDVMSMQGPIPMLGTMPIQRPLPMHATIPMQNAFLMQSTAQGAMAPQSVMATQSAMAARSSSVASAGGCAAAAGPGTTTSDSSEMSQPTQEELRAMTLPDLMDTINPQMLYELQMQAPHVISGLLAQSRGASAQPTSTAQQKTAACLPAISYSGASISARSAGSPVNMETPRRPLRRVAGARFTEGSELAAAAAAVAAEVAAQPTRSRRESGQKRAAESGADVVSREKRRMLRAERNRQSAASSRARKKSHVVELQRRFELLTADNERLERREVDAVRARVSKEAELVQENTALREKVEDRRKEINRLKEKLSAAPTAPHEQSAKHVDGKKELPRPSTWDNGKLGDAMREFLL